MVDAISILAHLEKCRKCRETVEECIRKRGGEIE
jgi:hypothetical protein